MAEVEAGLVVKVVAGKGRPQMVGAEVEETMGNPEAPGCVCLECISSLEGFGFGNRWWGAVAESEQALAERSSVRLRSGVRRLLPQTMSSNYLQQTERQKTIKDALLSCEKLHVLTAPALAAAHPPPPALTTYSHIYGLSLVGCVAFIANISPTILKC